MKNKDKQIDKLFSKGLSNYEESPSSLAWQTINKQLPKTNKRNVYWIAAAVSTVLISSTIAWHSILEKTNTYSYEINQVSLQANYPQKEFSPLPLLIHTKTIIYVEKKIFITPTNNKQSKSVIKNIPNLGSSIELSSIGNYHSPNADISKLEPTKSTYSKNEPITIIYKKGNPKYPKLANAVNFFKDVGEGEKPLIDFEKISASVLARRETTNNSNN